MIKKSRFLIPFALIGLVITGCTDASALQDNFSEEDLVIDTPWEEFVLPATGIEFGEGEDSIELNKGETHTYKYTIQPNGATANSLSWFSENENVASVSEGVVTAVGGGETTITASSPDSSFEPVELAVKVNVPLNDFSITIPERLERNERYELEVTFDPADTTYTDLTYEILNPSVEDVARVSGDNEITTGNVDGTATLKVTSAFLGEAKAHTYALNIDEIEISNIALTAADNADSVEINHGLQLTATVSPSNASALVKNTVKFYSRTTDIATVDEVTGVMSGVSAGEAHIYAKVGDYTSADLVINVFEVHASSVSITTPAFTLSNQNDNGLTKQLEYQITTDRAGYTEPSNAQIEFVSLDPTVATVNDSGLVTAVGAGTTDVKISIIQAGLAAVEDTVAVTVDLVSTSLSISGGVSFYNDESLTLTATLTPAKVTNQEITWSMEPATGVAVLTDNHDGTATLTPDNEDATGTVTVTATNTGGASNTATVTLLERNSEFTSGNHYIVGNTLLNTGVSTAHATKTSWDSAKYAYHFTNRINNTGSLEEYKGTIHFNAGDEFRYRVGANYVPNWEKEDSWPDRGYHIEQTGENNAFIKGQLEFVDPDDAQSNIRVVTAGEYDLYAKLYRNNDGTSWYALYIQMVPEISTSLPELTMGFDSPSYQIEVHDYIGAVTYTLIDGDTIIDAQDILTGLITVLGVAGVAHIKVSDSRGSETTVTVTVSSSAHGISKVVYLNANGTFDKDAHPFVYAWKGTGSNVQDMNTAMALVTGQTIIYTAEIPADYNNIIFVRNQSETTLDWALGQTKDLVIPQDGKDMFKPTGESDGKITGEWSTFDSSITYTKDVQPPYVMHKVGSADWSYAPLVADGDEQFKIEGLALVANEEFVINLGGTYGWRHFENLNEEYSSAFAAFGPGSATGDKPTDPHNFKVLTAGTFNFYVKKNIEADGGLNVFINHAGGAVVTTYTVSFNANGGSNTMADVPNQSGSYTLPANGFTAPTGQHFTGWKANNTGDLLAAGASYALSADVTFYAQWADDSVTPNNVTIYLTNNWNWGTLKAYVYDHADDTHYKVAWPGENLTYVGINDDNDDIYSYTVDINSYDRLIFANGGDGAANQTVAIDISAAETGDAFYFSGRESGDESNATVGTWDYTAAALTSYRVLYFTKPNDWSKVSVHMFEEGGSETTTWPGVEAKWVANNEFGQGVYRFLVDESKYDTIIVSDNGANQTADITLATALTGTENAFYLDSGVHAWTYTPVH